MACIKHWLLQQLRCYLTPAHEGTLHSSKLTLGSSPGVLGGGCGAGWPKAIWTGSCDDYQPGSLRVVAAMCVRRETLCIALERQTDGGGHAGMLVCMHSGTPSLCVCVGMSDVSQRSSVRLICMHHCHS